MQLLPVVNDEPYRQVAVIDVVGGGQWKDPDTLIAETLFEELLITVPNTMATDLLKYAETYIKATSDVDDFSIEMRGCHSFGMEVGRSTVDMAMSSNNLGEERAHSIVMRGRAILPEDLVAGEHGVIGLARRFYPDERTLAHSLVGLGKGHAVQLNGYMGHMYVGRTADILEWYRNPYQTGNPRNNLYVHRSPSMTARKAWRYLPKRKVGSSNR